MDNQEDGPARYTTIVHRVHVDFHHHGSRKAERRARERTGRGKRYHRSRDRRARVRKREQDYYFNGGLIWRVHKASDASGAEIVGERSVMGTSIAAEFKYIFEIYPTPRTSLSRLALRPLAHPSKRSIVRTFAPSVIADSAHTPSSNSTLPVALAYVRGGLYVRTSRVYTLVIRDLFARRARRW